MEPGVHKIAKPGQEIRCNPGGFVNVATLTRGIGGEGRSLGSGSGNPRFLQVCRQRGLYLAPNIPGGLCRSPGDFLESTWSPGAFFLAGSTAKLACIIHLDFTWTPGGLQMNHIESVESTCQIAVWILPGLNPGSIHQECRRSLFSLEFILLYIVSHNKTQKKK